MDERLQYEMEGIVAEGFDWVTAIIGNYDYRRLESL